MLLALNMKGFEIVVTTNNASRKEETYSTQNTISAKDYNGIATDQGFENKSKPPSTVSNSEYEHKKTEISNVETDQKLMKEDNNTTEEITALSYTINYLNTSNLSITTEYVTEDDNPNLNDLENSITHIGNSGSNEITITKTTREYQNISSGSQKKVQNLSLEAIETQTTGQEKLDVTGLPLVSELTTPNVGILFNFDAQTKKTSSFQNVSLLVGLVVSLLVSLTVCLAFGLIWSHKKKKLRSESRISKISIRPNSFTEKEGTPGLSPIPLDKSLLEKISQDIDTIEGRITAIETRDAREPLGKIIVKANEEISLPENGIQPILLPTIISHDDLTNENERRAVLPSTKSQNNVDSKTLQIKSSEHNSRESSPISLPQPEENTSLSDEWLWDSYDSYENWVGVERLLKSRIGQEEAKLSLNKKRRLLAAAIRNLSIEDLIADRIDTYENELQRISIMRDDLIEDMEYFLEEFQDFLSFTEILELHEVIRDVEDQVRQHALSIRKWALQMKSNVSLYGEKFKKKQMFDFDPAENAKEWAEAKFKAIVNGNDYLEDHDGDNDKFSINDEDNIENKMRSFRIRNEVTKSLTLTAIQDLEFKSHT